MTLVEDVDALPEAIKVVGANAVAAPFGGESGSQNLAGDLRAYLQGLVAA